MARLDGGISVRPLRMNYRHVTGKAVLGDGGVAAYESTLERDWLLVLDFDPTVRALRVQPFSLSYAIDGKNRRYTPDVWVQFDDDSVVVYEVKTRDALRAEWTMLKPRFKAAMRYCRERGWRFRLVTEREIRTPFLSNATFLRRYRHLPANPTIEAALQQALAMLGEGTAQAVLAAAFWCTDNRAFAVPYLWKLIATRQIGVCLMTPLTMSSLLWFEEA